MQCCAVITLWRNVNHQYPWRKKSLMHLVEFFCRGMVGAVKLGVLRLAIQSAFSIAGVADRLQCLKQYKQQTCCKSTIHSV